MPPRHQRRTPKTLPVLEASLAFLLMITCFTFATGSLVASPPPTTHVRSVSAPYHGGTSSINSTSTVGCGNVSVTHVGKFHLRTGVGGFDANSSAVTCASSPISSGSAMTDFGAGVALPYHRGTPTIYGNVSYLLNFNLSYSQGACHPTKPLNWQCARASYALVYVTAFLANRTTNYSWSLPGFFPVDEQDANLTQCQGGTCSTFTQSAPNGTQVVSGSHSFNFTMPVPMLKSSKYYFAIEIYCEVGAGDSAKHASVTGFSGAASLDLSGHGRGVVLTSVTET